MRRNKKTLAQLRETLGVTQEEMALLLKLPLSQIAMYETRKRELPFEALHLATAMYQYVIAQEAMVLTNKPDIKETMIMLLEEQIAAKKWQYHKNELKLEAMKKDYEKGKRYELLAHFFERETTLVVAEKKSTASYLRIRAKEKLEKNDPKAQLPYQLKTISLQSELHYLATQLANYQTSDDTPK